MKHKLLDAKLNAWLKFEFLLTSFKGFCFCAILEKRGKKERDENKTFIIINWKFMFLFFFQVQMHFKKFLYKSECKVEAKIYRKKTSKKHFCAHCASLIRVIIATNIISKFQVWTRNCTLVFSLTFTKKRFSIVSSFFCVCLSFCNNMNLSAQVQT